MPLDVAILGDDGTPEAEVHISVETHVDLMNHVRRSECPLLARMSDYYRDVDYSATEVPQLLEELVRLRDDVLDEAELNVLVGQLINLTGAALRTSTGLAVIAD